MFSIDSRWLGPAAIAALVLCLLPAVAPARIYQWVDEHGKVHFGDKPPPEAKRAATDLTERYAIDRNFELGITPHDYAMELDVKTKISVAVSKIFQVYADHLGMRPSSGATLEIHIYGVERDFRALTRSRGLQVENASGFYSPRENAIHVWRNRSPERLLAVLTHEASHAIMRHQIGHAPPWINEGLAEYFEAMHVFGQAVVVRHHRHWTAQIVRRLDEGLLPLSDYLAMSRDEWYTFNGSDTLAYALGWSVTFFLLSSEAGVDTVRALLTHYRDEGQSQRHEESRGAAGGGPAAVIERSYPGGFHRFEAGWREWALYGERRPHRY